MDGEILILDTNEFERKKIRSVLETLGNFRIIEVQGRLLLSEALDTLSSLKLVVLDLAFPTEKDGFEMLTALRKSPRVQSTPIIICTRLDKIELREKALSFNVSDYICKPYTINRLQSSVQALVKIDRKFHYDLSGIVNITLSFEEYVAREIKACARTSQAMSLWVATPAKEHKETSAAGNPVKHITTPDVTEIIRSSLRSTDTLFLNTNGDIFILLPSTDPLQAAIASDKIEKLLDKALETKNMKFSEIYYTVTVTHPTDGEDLQALISAAFKRLDSKQHLDEMTSILEGAREYANVMYSKFTRQL